MEQQKNALSDIAGTLGFALVAGLTAAFYWWFSGSLYSGGIWTLGTLFRFVAVLAIIGTAAGVIVGLVQIVLALVRNPE